VNRTVYNSVDFTNPVVLQEGSMPEHRQCKKGGRKRRTKIRYDATILQNVNNVFHK
jgi:hypothetical protein